MNAGFLGTLLVFAAALPAAAADSSIVQSTWTAGAVSGSSTSLQTGWEAYDSDDGNIVVLSTALQSLTGRARAWTQFDDSTGDGGFYRSTASISFASSVIKGVGASAVVAISTFETVATMPAVLPNNGRTEIGVAYHPTLKRFYLFGGINENGSLSSQILEYDPALGTLTTKPTTLPTARAGVAAAYDSIAARIFLFGGYIVGGTELNEIIEYNPITNTRSAEPVVLPSARAKMAAAYDNATKKIYLFGGEDFSGTKLDSIISYDGAFDTLITLSTPLPSGRWSASASFDPVSKKIYLFGGTGASGEALDEIVEFDATNTTWTVRSAVLPSTRTQTSAAYHPLTGKSYVFGGLTGDGTTDQIIEYDPVADSATTRNAVLGSSRTSTAAGYDTTTGAAFVFGGETSPGGGRTDQILRYTFHSSATFTSSIFDTSNLTRFTTLSYSPAAQFDASVGLSLSAKSGPGPTPGINWSNSNTFLPVANGGSLAGISPNRYVQYRATFTTTNLSTSSVLDAVTINYTQTAASAALVSSAFDLGSHRAVLRKLKFAGTFPSGTGAQFQLRTAPDAGGVPGTWTPWYGPSGGNFYTDPAGGTAINSFHADGVADRFVQYRALLYSTSTLAAAEVSSVTIDYNVLPASPSFASLIALSSDSIVATFVDQAATEDQIVVSTGFLPGSSSEGTIIASTDKAGTGTVYVSTITGFPPNTAVFVRARARNVPDSLDSFYTNEITTFTLANQPSSLNASQVWGTSITLTWNAGGNPTGTNYEISLSTDNFNLNVSTPFAFADSLTGTTTDLLDLSGGTTYYVRMRAQNGNLVRTAFSAVFSTATRVAPVSSLSGAGVGVSSIVFTWNTSGPSAQYNIYDSTSLSLLATVTTSSVAITGLGTNTTFAIRVEPFNASSNAGLSDAATAYSLSAVPSGLATVPLSTGSASLSWSASGNPAFTPYTILYSTDGFATSIATASVAADGFTSLTTAYAQLAAGTTYTFRVASSNGDGLLSDYASISTQTYPGTVSAVAGSALGISSLSWTWTNSAGPTVKSYTVFRGSSGVRLSTVSAAAYTDTGLLPNTTYGIRVQAVNLTGSGALPAETTAQTLAQAPTGSAVTTVFIDSITVNWNTNLNPADTNYSLERSTDNSVFAAVVSSAAGAASDLNLIGNTTYYYRVRAINGEGVPSAYDAVVSTYLLGRLPEPPSGFSAKSLSGGRIHLSWTISASTTIVRYNVYYDSGTGTIDYGTVFQAVPVPSTSVTTVPLTLGTTYLFGLRAENERGEEENNVHVVAAAVATAAPAALVASIRAPPPGTRIAGNHVTLRAGLDEGVFADVSRILFEYRAVGAGAWTAVSAVEALHPNPATERPFTTHWDVSGLATGVYELRAVARDSQGTDDPAPPSVRMLVDPNAPDFQENRGAGTRVIQRVLVRRAAPVTAEVSDGSGEWVLRVTLSSGSITAETDTLRIDTDPALKPIVSSSFSASGIYREITLESGQTTLQTGGRATITFAHLDPAPKRAPTTSASRSTTRSTAVGRSICPEASPATTSSRSRRFRLTSACSIRYPRPPPISMKSASTRIPIGRTTESTTTASRGPPPIRPRESFSTAFRRRERSAYTP
jgi:hypothetical protein